MYKYKCKIYYQNGWAEAIDYEEITCNADNYFSAIRQVFWSTDLEDEDIEKIEIERIE